MTAPTPIEHHAALGPIVWVEGGMKAKTLDGYEAEIMPSDISLPWLVKISEPPDAKGLVQEWGARCPDLRAARALIADVIGGFRDAERKRNEAVAEAREWVLALRGLPQGQF